jgi:hypothetical protein
MMRRFIVPVVTCVALAVPLGTASAEPPWDGYVESTQYPIRVHYTASAGLSNAEEALGYAEASWQIQVEQMGFPAPTTEDATGTIIPGLWIFLDPDGLGNYAEPIGDNPNTPWTDCTTRVVVMSLTPTYYFELVVYHEMNHVLEMSADCGESPFAMKNTTVAVTTLIWPDNQLFTHYFIPVFQSYPHHGVDCVFYMDQERLYYHYGAALFQIFLEDHYGDYDGVLLANIWEAAKQDGTITIGGMGISMDVPNSPNLIDAIESTLGGPTFDEAFVLFAQWRYFVGLRDDGEHFRDGNLWTGGELVLESEWALSNLPLANEVPANLPNDYGSVYLALDLDGIDDEHGVRFALTADPAVTWNVDVLLVRPDGTADVETMPAGAAEVTLDSLVDYDQAVFIVSNLGDGNHNPDLPQCSTGRILAYNLEMVATAVPPAIASVDPTELEIGVDHHLWIYGTGFVDGAQVAFDGQGPGPGPGPGIEVTGVTFVDETTLSVDVTVAPDATPGGRSLTVTNPNTLSYTLADAVTLFSPDDNDDDDPKGGCSCTATASGGAGGGAGGFLLWSLILGLLLGRAHRKHDGSRSR